MSVFSKRLKEARLKKGYSQEQLGIEAGLDPMSASTRMNRYELAKRAPDFSLIERLAEVLDVPTAYLFAEDDELAKLIKLYGQSNPTERAKILKELISD